MKIDRMNYDDNGFEYDVPNRARIQDDEFREDGTPKNFSTAQCWIVGLPLLVGLATLFGAGIYGIIKLLIQ